MRSTGSLGGGGGGSSSSELLTVEWSSSGSVLSFGERTDPLLEAIVEAVVLSPAIETMNLWLNRGSKLIKRFDSRYSMQSTPKRSIPPYVEATMSLFLLSLQLCPLLCVDFFLFQGSIRSSETGGGGTLYGVVTCTPPFRFLTL